MRALLAASLQRLADMRGTPTDTAILLSLAELELEKGNFKGALRLYLKVTKIFTAQIVKATMTIVPLAQTWQGVLILE